MIQTKITNWTRNHKQIKCVINTVFKFEIRGKSFPPSNEAVLSGPQKAMGRLTWAVDDRHRSHWQPPRQVRVEPTQSGTFEGTFLNQERIKSETALAFTLRPYLSLRWQTNEQKGHGRPQSIMIQKPTTTTSCNYYSSPLNFVTSKKMRQI